MLGNRIAKAAMEENMAGDGQLPDEELSGLYALASAAGMAQVRHQMRRIARGSRPTPNTHPAGHAHSLHVSGT
ncbi:MULTISPECIES: hypothetical protein [unclassified Streptomyces]|uniref:hypothetical protein n=1 Tax=unclassified Streptomyces TaxID=2593676 RepID=UPI000B89392A|nr:MULTISPECIES: hypothetical protein [unclassified Streptomyces]